MDSLIAENDPSRLSRPRAALLSALVLLFLAVVGLLMVLAFQHRGVQLQRRAQAAATSASEELSLALSHDMATLLALPPYASDARPWDEAAAAALVQHPELFRVERRDAQLQVTHAVDSRIRPPLFSALERNQFKVDTELACTTAQRRDGPIYSRSYFVPNIDGTGQMVMDLCVADPDHAPGGASGGYLVATYGLSQLLDALPAQNTSPGYDVILLDTDGTRIAHGRRQSGEGAYVADSVFTVPGVTMLLRVDSAGTRPSLVPDLVTGLVGTLAVTLLCVVAALVRDVLARTKAEAALADSLSFRKAMEDSVVTGLRARDLQGRTTYVNLAFCAMVGYSPEELIGVDPPPYWPPEEVDRAKERLSTRLSKGVASRLPPREAVFVRKNGERFPVMIFEAPLMSSTGRQRGWMSSMLDLSEQRRVEEVARQQQERLQATARLATVGEMASLLSHELNQPLYAISAYATGSLNMMDNLSEEEAAAPGHKSAMRNAIARIAEQSERAGRVIKSVHDFVRRREGSRETVSIQGLLESVEPLVALQARKSGTRVAIEIDPATPRVLCDSAMVEQVLLNLTRNGIQAMQNLPPERERVLTIRARARQGPWVEVAIIDGGEGIAPDVERSLFSPFFTTRAEGMGLGLSVCRTIIEQHGGALVFSNRVDPAGTVLGAQFTFTLPAAGAATRS